MNLHMLVPRSSATCAAPGTCWSAGTKPKKRAAVASCIARTLAADSNSGASVVQTVRGNSTNNSIQAF